MGIEFDNATYDPQPVSSNSSIAHTCTGGSLILFFFASHKNNNVLVDGPTYGGDALTKASTNANVSSSNTGADLWYIISPKTGSNNLVANLSATNSAIGLVSYTGVNPAAPFGTIYTTNPQAVSSVSQDIPSAIGELVIDFAAMTGGEDRVADQGAGQTERIQPTRPWTAPGAGVSEEAPAASVTMSWTCSLSVHWCHFALSLKPIGGGNQGIMLWFDDTFQKVRDQWQKKEKGLWLPDRHQDILVPQHI